MNKTIRRFYVWLSRVGMGSKRCDFDDCPNLAELTLHGLNVCPACCLEMKKREYQLQANAARKYFS